MRRSRARRGQSPCIDQLENRRLLSVSSVPHDEVVVIGSGGSNGVTFTASNGRYTGITAGAETATIVLSGLSIPGTVKGHTYFTKGIVETVVSITLTNAVPNRGLLGIRASFGTGSFDVGSITGGNLRGIIAPDVNLVGSVNIASIGTMIVNSVAGAAMNLGSSAGSIRINGAMTGSLTAAKINSLSAGQITNSTITATRAFSRSVLQIGTVRSAGTIEDSEIISSGNIGTIRAKSIDGSVVLAAANATPAATGQFPTAEALEFRSAFYQPAAIHTILILPGAGAGLFNNSVIAAETIGNAHLGQMGPGGGAISAHNFASVVVTSPEGNLDLAGLHLGQAQLRSSSRLSAVLSSRGIAHEDGLLGPDNVLALTLNLNVLG